jgi:hypothetical protein
LKVLKSGREWDWTGQGQFKGLSGHGGATKIRDMVVGEFKEEGKVSIKRLAARIIK